MQNQYGQQSEIVFVVESCQNCKEHGWNTRHDEAKYTEFFKRIAAAIIDRIPNAMIMKNQIPKSYLPFDLYNNLVPNEDENTPYFQQVPRTGAFEISYKGMLVFSKLKGGYWPNCDLVADKCLMAFNDESQGKDCTQYLAGNSPQKGGGFGPSGKKGRQGGSMKALGDTPQRASNNKSGLQQQQQFAQDTQQPMGMQDERDQYQSFNDAQDDQPLRVNENNQGSYQQSSKFTGDGPDVVCGAHLKHWDELTGFPVFPKGSKSHLARNLTRDVWAQLKDTKDAYGFPFKQAIFSGCKHTHLGMGIFAGSPDSYKAFAPLMDKAIETYHGHGKNAKHVSDMDYRKLKCPPFPPDEDKMIKSTRIRVARSLQGLPLGAQCTKEERKEVERLITSALAEFDGDLKGKYYSLETMSAADEAKLIDDHFLFKNGKDNTEACGLERDWPSARGIFHNDAKTFLSWINEEDELRIISMQPGSDIGAVFERISRACAIFEKKAKFVLDDHLGYVVSCPTNLGTGLRGSCHIHLPNLGQNMEYFEQIADKYYVQIRGAHGEHTSTDDGIFDISNRRRLGRTEVQLVQDMYDGVKAMITAEKELAIQNAPKAGDVQCGSHMKHWDELTGFPVFPPSCKSHLKKCLTRELWEQLKDKKDSYGFPFKQAIFSGCKHNHLGMGVFAGSPDSYKAFSPLMDKLIESYHGHKPGAIHKADMDYTKLNCPPFPPDEDAMIKSTRIRVARSLQGVPLGAQCTKEERKEVERLLTTAAAQFTGDLKGTYYSLETMSKADEAKLIDDHFLFKNGKDNTEACGLERDWPSGRGIFHNDAKTFLSWINEEDELRIISMQKGSDIGAVFERLSRGAAAFEKQAKFVLDDHLGFVVSCPTNLGTGLRGSMHVHLPCLGKNMDYFEEIAAKYHVQIRGAHGEHTSTDDGIFDISNSRRLGRSEVQLVQDMYDGIKAMIKAEKELSGKGAAVTNGPDVQCGSHMKHWDELTGFPIFPASCKSHLKKCLTREIWDQLKDKKDAYGMSFKQAIFSGCKHNHLGMGVFAGSPDSYKAFAPLMDALIESYHGHKPGAVHKADMDYTKLNCPPFPPDEDAMIVSTRIRVARSLQGVPLGACCSKEERKEVERLLTTAASQFTGDLKGTYYSLETMSKADEAKLIDDHFLFKNGKDNTEACGLERDWPSGRGIFHNDAKTFLSWINEEDELRIISMQKGSDLGAVFERLSRGAAAFEKLAKFVLDDHLGFVVSCPTNLGTGLRGSMHVHLPCLGKKMDHFETIAAKFFVQVRGAHGEHTSTDDGIFDISNSRRLGRSEVQLVQDMYDGIKQMIKAEKELKGGAGGIPAQVSGADVQCGSHLKHWDELTGFPIFPASCKSHLKKCLTRELWEQLKDKKDAYGMPFKQAIFSGCKHTHLGMGVFAGSPDSYKAFAPLMDALIESYHGHKKDAMHKADMDYTKLKCPPFPPDEDAMIKSTRIRVARSLQGVPLGACCSKEERKEVERLLTTAAGQFTGDLKGTYYSLETMSKADEAKLIDDHFLFKNGKDNTEACGLERDWPSGRGIFHNDAKTFLSWINEEDELRIISMQKGSDLGAVFERLSRGAAAFEKLAKFVLDDHLGFVVSCPTNLGTGLRGSMHVHLPCLGKKMDHFETIAAKYFVQVRGAHGEHTSTDDGIFDISNSRRLGRSEVELVQDMYDGIKQMIKAEKELNGGAGGIPAQVSGTDVQCGSHLKHWDELTGFPIFPASCKSHLKKCLTRELWEQLKDKKDAYGMSFKQAIFSGCKHTHLGMGVFAGSPDSYKAFAPLMDALIESYHGHKKDDKHLADMDYTKLKCPPFPADEDAMIKSTRIRVARSLEGLPLGACETKEQRKEVEILLTTAAAAFTGDLKGTYYSLETMSKADEAKLIDDHFLFKNGKDNTEACGLERDWPSGRGIFHNDDKTFLSWINEEDELRIISMQKGSDIGAVFERLSRGAAAFEKQAKFVLDDHLGFVVSCPTNLGTGLRGSMHVHLPNLGKNMDYFESIAAKYFVQVRGAHGEHTSTDDGIFDVSNSRRLGRSEVQLVQDMYDGIKQMIKAEKELVANGGKVPAGGDVKVGSHLKHWDELTGFPIFPDDCKSHLKKCLTREIWEEFKDKKDSYGFPFKQAIFSGCKHTHLGMGVFAGSPSTYVDFAKFTDALIESYHGHKPTDKHLSDMDHTHINCPPFPPDEDKMIKSTRMRVARSLDGLPLGACCNKEERKKVEQTIVSALNEFDGELKGSYYSLETMTKEDEAKLIDDHFLFKSGKDNTEACGLERDWPQARGIFHNDAKTFLCWINEEDELRIISMQQGSDIGAVFKRLSVAAARIEEKAKFVQNDHLGYVVSCPTNLGTGLRASVHIHLPKLGKKMDKFQEIADKYFVQIRGAHGEHTSTDDGIFDISNLRRLGRSEAQLVQDMYDGVKQMIAAEKALP